MPQTEMCRDKYGEILTDEREVIERWKQHFDEHLNGPEAEYQDEGRNEISKDEPVLATREVKKAIKKLKNNKAAGKGGIGVELIKMGLNKLATCQHQLYFSWYLGHRKRE
uniref:(northern house mosquito) hypothetical protein n=1 Tax=Culex pipiens TaxID=7175 RepID=A0A8D8D0K0_CULPI